MFCWWQAYQSSASENGCCVLQIKALLAQLVDRQQGQAVQRNTGSNDFDPLMADQIETIEDGTTSIMKATMVPQAPPDLRPEHSLRYYDPVKQRGRLKIWWLEPDFLPVPCSGYRILMDDGKDGIYKKVYEGPPETMEAIIGGLHLDRFYRLKLQATTKQGAGPVTPVMFYRIGTRHTYTEDFDKNGIIYFIGTDGLKAHFSNPANKKTILATRSTTQIGHANMMCGRENNPSCSLNQERQWYQIDLGEKRLCAPSHYTLKGNPNVGIEQPRSWWFQASSDGMKWKTLKEHKQDAAVKGAGSSFTWEVNNPDEDLYRYFRLVQVDKNSSFTHRFHCTGFELYGILISNHYGNYSDPST